MFAFIKSLRLAAILSTLVFGGGAAVTVTQNGASDFTYYPHYEERKHFFLWGFVGEHTVNTRAVWKTRRVKQMQNKFTLTDVALAAITAGLYLPRTAMVWCERETQS